MVFTVRCFKCGESSVRLVLGGRTILHAKCESCGENLLDDVMKFELEVNGKQKPKRESQPTIEMGTVGGEETDVPGAKAPLGDESTAVKDD